MLPARSIIVFSLFSIAAAFPADKSSQSPLTALLDQNVEKGSIYSTFPLFSIFKPIIEMFPNFSDIGPKIQVGDKYTNIIVKAKNYNVDDLSVKIKGKVVFLQGHRKTEDGDRDFASEFLYTTSLPENVNTNDVFAKYYSDGYLVVTTPNEGKKDGVYVDREVPIVVMDELFIKPEENVSAAPASTESIPEATTVPASSPDIPEASTQAETDAPSQEVVAQSTTNVPEPTDVATEVVEEKEKESTKAEEMEATTPYIEEVTQNSTPSEANEISD